MEVDLRHCGLAANTSEVAAFNRLKAGLVSLRGDRKWILLTNLTLSVTHQRQSDVHWNRIPDTVPKRVVDPAHEVRTEAS